MEQGHAAWPRREHADSGEDRVEGRQGGRCCMVLG
jgi:hypothetical protein